MARFSPMRTSGSTFSGFVLRVEAQFRLHGSDSREDCEIIPVSRGMPAGWELPRSEIHLVPKRDVYARRSLLPYEMHKRAIAPILITAMLNIISPTRNAL